MENTWNREITKQALEAEKNFYQNYISEYPNSSLNTRFMEELKNSYVYNTNAIEGNPITEYDTAYIIKSNTFLEEYSAKDNMEVLGSSKAWDYMMDKPEISLQTILNIHKHVLFFDVNHAGVFRQIPVHVGDKQILSPENIEESMSQYDKSKEKGVQGLYNLITKYEHEELLKFKTLVLQEKK